MSDPSFPDLVSVIVTWIAEKQGMEAQYINRVSSVTLKTPSSFFDWYREAKYIKKFFDDQMWFSPIVWQVLLVLGCVAYNGTFSGKCYDNVFADTQLMNGNPYGGVIEYVDIFSFDGMRKILVFALAYYSAKYLIKNTYLAFAEAVIFFVTPDTSYCDEFDWVEEELFKFSLCTLFRF